MHANEKKQNLSLRMINIFMVSSQFHEKCKAGEEYQLHQVLVTDKNVHLSHNNAPAP